MLDQHRYLNLWIWLALSAVLLCFWCFLGSSFDLFVLINTISLGALSALISIPTGALLANCSGQRGLLGRLCLLFILSFAFVPIVFQVSCWDAAFGKLGWLTSRLTGANQPLVSSWAATIWIHAAALTPQLALLFLAAILGGSKVYEEQAALDSGRSQVFWHILLPRFLPLIAVGVCWSIISCSREIAVTDIYQVGTLAEQVYLGFSLGQFDSLLGPKPISPTDGFQSISFGLQISTIAWLVFSATLIFANLLKPEQNSAHVRPSFKSPSQGWLGVASTALTLIVLFGIPVWNLLARSSYHVARIDGQPVGSHSFSNFTQAIARACSEYVPQTHWSLLIAAGCTITTLAFAIGLAWMARQSPRARIPVIMIVSVCFALPGPVIGTGLLQIYNQVDHEFIQFLYNRTVLPVIVADVIVCLPIATLLLWFVFSATPIDAEEHLRTEGARGFRVFWQLGVLSNIGPIFGVAILCFVIGYGELSATQMVLPPGVETVPRLTLGLMHSGVNKMTAALTIVNLSAIIAISALGWMLVSLKWRTRRQQ
jgi:iron(III) transport system permease protein